MDGNIPVMHGMPIAALCRQDGLTGSAWGDWAQYTDSPLRAFENELRGAGRAAENGPVMFAGL